MLTAVWNDVWHIRFDLTNWQLPFTDKSMSYETKYNIAASDVIQVLLFYLYVYWKLLLIRWWITNT